jgi:deoxyinosine 3'endonuclease (endonuclease V)
MMPHSKGENAFRRDCVPAAWLEKQTLIAGGVDDSFDRVDLSSLRYVGGADVTFSARDPTLCVACLVVCEFPSLAPVAVRQRVTTISVPYIPGFLAFREADAILLLLEDLAREGGDVPMPQLLMIDGNGLLHDMGAGVACHVGVRSGIPTIGAAKSFFSVTGRLSHEAVKGVCRQFLHQRGDYLLLLADASKGGAPIGAAVWATSDVHAAKGMPSSETSRAACACRGGLSSTGGYVPDVADAAAACVSESSGGRGKISGSDVASAAAAPFPKGAHGTGSCNPIFVSIGHGMTLRTSIQLVLACCLHRVVEPVRLADKQSRHAMTLLDSVSAAAESAAATPSSDVYAAAPEALSVAAEPTHAKAAVPVARSTAAPVVQTVAAASPCQEVAAGLHQSWATVTARVAVASKGTAMAHTSAGASPSHAVPVAAGVLSSVSSPQRAAVATAVQPLPRLTGAPTLYASPPAPVPPLASPTSDAGATVRAADCKTTATPVLRRAGVSGTWASVAAGGKA